MLMRSPLIGTETTAIAWRARCCQISRGMVVWCVYRRVPAHYFGEQRGSRNGRTYGTEPTKRKHGVKHAAIQEKARQQEQQNLEPWKQQKRRHRASATLQHTISRNSAASAAELGPMKQRHTGMGTTNIRNGTANKKLSQLEYKVEGGAQLW